MTRSAQLWAPAAQALEVLARRATVQPGAPLRRLRNSHENCSSCQAGATLGAVRWHFGLALRECKGDEALLTGALDFIAAVIAGVSEAISSHLFQVRRDKKALEKSVREWADRGRTDAFSHVNLQYADLRRVELGGGERERGADLSYADLRKARLESANLSRANLYGTDLRRAELQMANLSHATVVEADLRRAKLQHAKLCGGDLCAAKLGKADLRGADLRCANLSAANLRKADLRGAKLQDATMDGANLSTADLRDANLSDANLAGADLRRAKLSGANLQFANLFGAHVPEACLAEATVGGATLPDGTVREIDDASDADRRGQGDATC